MKIGWLFAVASTLLFCGMVEAAEIKVLSTRATEEFYRELVPQFENASGHKVTTTFTGTLDLQKRIAAGETYDVIIMVNTATTITSGPARSCRAAVLILQDRSLAPACEPAHPSLTSARWSR
jgi:molybdate transport system substrate-binding protein